jgi:hypothetical protein
MVDRQTRHLTAAAAAGKNKCHSIVPMLARQRVPHGVLHGHGAHQHSIS